MRIFLLTLLISTVLSIVLWNFGLAHRIWPAHPVLATAIVAAVGAAAFQLMLTRDRSNDSARK